MSIDTSFEEPQKDDATRTLGELVLDLEGFEGPIDLLLTLAREQKVDLSRISILQLADQYLEFIAGARAIHLDIAAEYLVMAAWLAYLKSRLLLPEEEKDEDEPSGEEIAALLAFQLRRLEAMREAAVEPSKVGKVRLSIAVVLFLAGGHAANITGSDIRIDGGYVTTL